MHNDRPIPPNVVEIDISCMYEGEEIEMFGWLHFDPSLEHVWAVSTPIPLSKVKLRQVSRENNVQVPDFVVDYVTKLLYKG